MKKKIINTTLLLIIFVSVFSINCRIAFAAQSGRVMATNGLSMRNGAGTTYSVKTTIPYNKTVTVNSTNTKTSDGSNGCSTGIWYNVTYSSYTGYVCSRYIELLSTPTQEPTNQEIPKSDISKMTDAEFDAYLNKQGFPESYKTKLKSLHAKHPNWVFVGVKSRDNWSTTLKNENVSGRSLYQSTSSSTQGYLSTADGNYDWYTNKFKAKDGSTWFQASEKTIAYYMDPRNWLNESNVFMFEDLNYYSSYQTIDAVNAILYTDFYKDINKHYITAAKSYNVSPIYLAALTRQEVGLSSGYATSGKTSSFCDVDYTGYYNFYNIQATSGTKPVCNGLKYAKAQGWNTKEKAITLGAKWIANGYINIYQNTPYFQKWNTSSKSKNINYYHQYMTNVKAVVSSSSTTYNSYKSMGIIDYPIVFQIPIYDGIPTSTSLPATGNPNNYLKTLKVNGSSVTNFDGADTSYTVTIANPGNVTIASTAVASTSTITGNGTFNIANNGDRRTVVVKAQNGSTKTYTITFKVTNTSTNTNTGNDNNNNNNNDNTGNTNTGTNTNNDQPTINYLTPEETVLGSGYKVKSNYLYNVTLGSTVEGSISKFQKANSYASITITNNNDKAKTSGSLVTGDKITITSNNKSNTYIVVIYGDLNGDGNISIVDLARLQKYLLKQTTLNGGYYTSADVNKDGKIDIVDLAKVQKHLLKVSNISQS